MDIFRLCSARAFQVAFSVLAELKLYFFKNSMFGKIAYQINFRVLSSWLKTLLSLTFHKTLLAFTPEIPIIPLKFFHIYMSCHCYKTSCLSPQTSAVLRHPPPLLPVYLAGTVLPSSLSPAGSPAPVAWLSPASSVSRLLWWCPRPFSLYRYVASGCLYVKFSFVRSGMWCPLLW